jgi:hypothetical protein
MSAARPRRMPVVTCADSRGLWRPAQHLPQPPARHLAQPPPQHRALASRFLGRSCRRTAPDLDARRTRQRPDGRRRRPHRLPPVQPGRMEPPAARGHHSTSTPAKSSAAPGTPGITPCATTESGPTVRSTPPPSKPVQAKRYGAGPSRPTSRTDEPHSDWKRATRTQLSRMGRRGTLAR